MQCGSPQIDVPSDLVIDPDQPIHLQYGFRMDNVSGVQNLSVKQGYPSFSLYPNPVYDRFDEEVKYYKSDYLTINVSIRFRSPFFSRSVKKIKINKIIKIK